MPSTDLHTSANAHSPLPTYTLLHMRTRLTDLHTTAKKCTCTLRFTNSHAFLHAHSDSPAYTLLQSAHVHTLPLFHQHTRFSPFHRFTCTCAPTHVCVRLCTSSHKSSRLYERNALECTVCTRTEQHAHCLPSHMRRTARTHACTRAEQRLCLNYACKP